MVAEEVNVKAITTGKDVRLDTKLTNELKSEGLMRELVRHIQSGRKKAGLNVEDRIRLGLNTDSTVVRQTIKQHEVTIKAETLAVELKDAVIDGGYSEEVNIDANPVTISLKKHS